MSFLIETSARGRRVCRSAPEQLHPATTQRTVFAIPSVYWSMDRGGPAAVGDGDGHGNGGDDSIMRKPYSSSNHSQKSTGGGGGSHRQHHHKSHHHHHQRSSRDVDDPMESTSSALRRRRTSSSTHRGDRYDDGHHQPHGHQHHQQQHQHGQPIVVYSDVSSEDFSAPEAGEIEDDQLDQLQSRSSSNSVSSRHHHRHHRHDSNGSAQLGGRRSDHHQRTMTNAAGSASDRLNFVMSPGQVRKVIMGSPISSSMSSSGCRSKVDDRSHSPAVASLPHQPRVGLLPHPVSPMVLPDFEGKQRRGGECAGSMASRRAGVHSEHRTISPVAIAAAAADAVRMAYVGDDTGVVVSNAHGSDGETGDDGASHIGGGVVVDDDDEGLEEGSDSQRRRGKRSKKSKKSKKSKRKKKKRRRSMSSVESISDNESLMDADVDADAVTDLTNGTSPLADVDPHHGRQHREASSNLSPWEKAGSIGGSGYRDHHHHKPSPMSPAAVVGTGRSGTPPHRPVSKVSMYSDDSHQMHRMRGSGTGRGGHTPPTTPLHQPLPFHQNAMTSPHTPPLLMAAGGGGASRSQHADAERHQPFRHGGHPRATPPQQSLSVLSGEHLQQSHRRQGNSHSPGECVFRWLVICLVTMCHSIYIPPSSCS